MRAFGTDGCNNFTAPIRSIGEQTLALGPRAGTRKACRQPDVPQRVNDALDRVVGYERRGLTLRLLDAADNTLLTYQKVD